MGGLDEADDMELVLDGLDDDQGMLQEEARNNIGGGDKEQAILTGYEGESPFAFAGDTAVNLVSDVANAEVDVAGFQQVEVGFGELGDLAVTATDDTLHWAFSGAGAYAGASSKVRRSRSPVPLPSTALMCIPKLT